jgi:hypothetical protein
VCCPQAPLCRTATKHRVDSIFLQPLRVRGTPCNHSSFHCAFTLQPSPVKMQRFQTIYISLLLCNHRNPFKKCKKVKLSPCLTNWALLHEGVWESGCIDPHFLELDTSWRWVVSFTPLPLYLQERAPGTHCIGGWVDPRAGLDDMAKWKFLTLPGLELRLSVVQPVASRYTDCAIPAHSKKCSWLIYMRGLQLGIVHILVVLTIRIN